MRKEIACVAALVLMSSAVRANGNDRHESAQKAAEHLKKAAQDQKGRPKIWHGPVKRPQPRAMADQKPRRSTHLGHGPVQINNPVLLEQNMKQRIVRAVNELKQQDPGNRSLDQIKDVKTLIEDFEGFEAAHEAKLPDNRKTQQSWQQLDARYESATKAFYEMLEQAQRHEEAGIKTHMVELRGEKKHEETLDDLIGNVKKLIKKIEGRRHKPTHHGGPARPIKNPLAS